MSHSFVGSEGKETEVIRPVPSCDAIAIVQPLTDTESEDSTTAMEVVGEVCPFIVCVSDREASKVRRKESYEAVRENLRQLKNMQTRKRVAELTPVLDMILWPPNIPEGYTRHA